MAEIKIGDKVKFGAYGDFDNETSVCEVKEITPTLKLLGGVVYTLINSNGQAFDAYKDEVKLIS